MNHFRHIRCAILIALMLALTAFNSHAGGVMLVSASQELNQSLSREQVRNLYMGASLGYGLKPLALPPRNRLRSRFNTQVIGLPESRIQSYWAQMKFTGRMKAPKTLASENAVLEYLLQNPGSVGYVAADTELPTSIQVIFRTGDQ